MGREITRNDAIPDTYYTDLAGNSVKRAGAGTLRLGDDPAFQGYQAYSTDGVTKTSMPAEDAVLSNVLVCDCCGIPVRHKRDLAKTPSGFRRCRQCIDKE